jgi:uncharacterized repeat protein (TIGR03803 family)
MVNQLSRYTICAVLIAALVACGGSPPPIIARGAMPQSRALAPTRGIAHRSAPSSSYQVLYSFAGSSNGAHPAAALAYVNGTLYGTTSEGGGYGCVYGYTYYGGCGTVFRVTTSGKERVLYRFLGQWNSPPDGWNPQAGLVDVNGMLYGTTAESFIGCNRTGACGTVYSVSTSGTETGLYAFKRSSDGTRPQADLIDVNGVLYGTAKGGNGYCGCGSVFSVTTSGQEIVLHRFAGGGSDGAYPTAGLLYVKGVFYGTTESGGDAPCPEYGSRCGTVFSITPGGAEKVLYNFQGPAHSDGAEPTSGLIYVKGMLYGTTYSGGQTSCDCGTVFRVSTTGVEKVLHSFGTGSDGEGPVPGLTQLNGLLYGTTRDGGMYGNGTVFSISRSGTERVLHSFGTGSDGKWPVARLVDVNGTLYGTTSWGGTRGKGTVFSLTP